VGEGNGIELEEIVEVSHGSSQIWLIFYSSLLKILLLFLLLLLLKLLLLLMLLLLLLLFLLNKNGLSGILNKLY